MVLLIQTEKILECRNLGSRSLDGSIPTELGLLSGLGYLYEISICVLLMFAHLSIVVCSELGSNSLNGSIPSELGNLENLSHL